MVGGSSEPIPETNIGNKILQSMGWTPGSGLGPHGTGITSPVLAVKRNGRRGVGHAASSSHHPSVS